MIFLSIIGNHKDLQLDKWIVINISTISFVFALILQRLFSFLFGSGQAFFNAYFLVISRAS